MHLKMKEYSKTQYKGQTVRQAVELQSSSIWGGRIQFWWITFITGHSV